MKLKNKSIYLNANFHNFSIENAKQQKRQFLNFNFQ